MDRVASPLAKRPRISIDVDPELRRRLRLAAARQDRSVRQYVVDAIEQRLREDDRADAEGAVGLAAATDPVLADLWRNERDAEYDRL